MVYVFLADGFEEIEALAPIDILRRAEIPTLAVGIDGLSVTGAHGIKVTADIDYCDLDMSQCNMIVLPGGKGHINLKKSSVVNSAIDYAVEHNLYIGAICAAPSILGEKGLLSGKHATCYPGYEEHCTGIIKADAPVVIDGNIITADGAAAALNFGFALVSALSGKEKADEISSSMQVKK